MPLFISIGVSLLFALVLTLLPMPDWAIWIRPEWVLMTLIFWAMWYPEWISVGMAWFVGMILDSATGSLFGEHALSLVIIIYFVDRLSIRLRMFPLIQQSLIVFCLSLTYQFILFCIQGFIGELPISPLFWLSSVLTMLLWPWLSALLRQMAFRFRLAT